MKTTSTAKLKKYFNDFNPPTQLYAVVPDYLVEDESIEKHLESKEMDLAFAVLVEVPNQEADSMIKDAVKLMEKADYDEEEGCRTIACWKGKSTSLIMMTDSPDPVCSEVLASKWKKKKAIFVNEGSVESDENFYDSDGVLTNAPFSLKKRIWESMKKYKSPGKDLTGKSFCFTGFRDKDLETQITNQGGKIQKTVNKGLTYLVCMNPEEGESSKIEKAEELGVKVVSMVQLLRSIL